MALTGVQKTVLVCVASIALVVGAVVNKVTRPAPLDRNALQQAGVYLFDSPRALPEVSLRSAADQPWGLDDLNGQWDLLFFGYTFCPDICPTTLAELRQLMQKLPEETRGQLQVTLVSVDPNRDTRSNWPATWSSSTPASPGPPVTASSSRPWPRRCQLPISSPIPAAKTIWSITAARW